jgi:hypothetical protein
VDAETGKYACAHVLLRHYMSLTAQHYVCESVWRWGHDVPRVTRNRWLVRPGHTQKNISQVLPAVTNDFLFHLLYALTETQRTGRTVKRWKKWKSFQFSFYSFLSQFNMLAHSVFVRIWPAINCEKRKKKIPAA